MQAALANVRRFEWIDLARGVGVCLVVFTHLKTHMTVDIALRSFLIPMYLMVSGFLYGVKPGFRAFTTAKAKRLLVPSAAFTFLGVAVCSIRQGLATGLLALRSLWDARVPFNEPVWFFIVLFEVYIIEFALNGIRKTTFGRVAMAAGFFAMGNLLYTFGVSLPFGLHKAVVAAGFFNVGEVLRVIFNNFGDALRGRRRLTIVVLMMLLAIWAVFGVVLNDCKVSFNNFFFGNYWYCAISGVAGATAFLTACCLVDGAKGLGFFKTAGLNSVFIMGTHYVFTKAFRSAASHFGHVDSVAYFMLAASFVLLLVKAYEPVCTYLDDRAPWLTGKMS